ncbi:MAG: competence/damage-inducible protein A [Chitinophagaceae bacterium]
MEQTFASIITIGDELLIGQVIDTNSAFIGRSLNAIGVSVKHRLAVGDAWNDIWQALDAESKNSSIVLITGGLGPTADDITKPLLCDYFGGKMVVDPGALENVEAIFRMLNRPMIERNRKQAEVPDNCTVIPNKRGTAPGMLFEKNGVVFISMPGVPNEMQGMITDYVLPYLTEVKALPTIIHKTLVTNGIGESSLADLLQPWEESLPENIKLAYLPNYGMVRLRLTAIGPVKEVLEQAVEKEFETLQSLVAEFLVTTEDEPMEKVLGRILLNRGETMATAESCTGGYIAHLITSMAGSSAYYNGSVVSYSYEAKEDILGVDHDLLQTHGAVSEAVVIEMVKGALKQLKTTYAIAVSGIMGPGGGTDDKPAGTVWVAVGNDQQTATQKFYFRFDRKRNIELTANNAMNLLRKFIIGQK